MHLWINHALCVKEKKESDQRKKVYSGRHQRPDPPPNQAASSSSSSSSSKEKDDKKQDQWLPVVVKVRNIVNLIKNSKSARLGFEQLQRDHIQRYHEAQAKKNDALAAALADVKVDPIVLEKGDSLLRAGKSSGRQRSRAHSREDMEAADSCFPSQNTDRMSWSKVTSKPTRRRRIL